MEYARLRAHKGMTLERARDIVLDVSYFGTLMVHAGPRRRHGLGRRPFHRAHDHTVVRDHQDRPGDDKRVVGVLHVPRRPRARLWRLRNHPRPDRRGTGRHRRIVCGHRRPVRARPARGDAVVLHRRVRNGRRCGQGQGGDGAREVSLPRTPGRRPAPVRRRSRFFGGRGETAGIGCRRPRQRVHLPRPQHGQQHLQGCSALVGRSRDRPGPAGPEQAGQRPLPWRDGPRHRQHGRHHRDPGAGGHGGAGRRRSPRQLPVRELERPRPQLWLVVDQVRAGRSLERRPPGVGSRGAHRRGAGPHRACRRRDDDAASRAARYAS